MTKKRYSNKKIVNKTKYSLTPVKEIAVRNELPIFKAREAYKECRKFVFKETVKDVVHGKINLNLFAIRDKVFELTEKYLDLKRIKDLDRAENFYKLRNFSSENKISYSSVKNIYSKYNSRISPNNSNGSKLEETLSYEPKLGKKAFDLTKRYFEIKRNNKSN